jgi:FtsH-binding integral membrane protein
MSSHFVPSMATAEVERRFIASVYRWMALGLALTGGLAWYISGNEAAIRFFIMNRPVFYVAFAAELGLVLVLSLAVTRLSAPVAGTLFLLYSALNGVTLSVIFLVYTHSSIAMAFGTASAAFLGMSVYGTVTKKDLTSWRSFLFMGLFGIVIGSLINMFVGSDGMGFVLSCASVVVFTGLTAYDTQKLRAYAAAGGNIAAMPINGALMLYLDFINLFLALLRIFGRRR